MRYLSYALLLLGTIGCDGDSDAGLDGGATDAAARDASSPLDGASPTDAEAPDAAAPVDAGESADAGSVVNPSVPLVREITFEQPDGTNGWSDSDRVIFNWQDAATGRDRVPDAFVRGATGINVPDVATDIAYRGSRSVLLTMQPWGSRSTFRTDLEMVGDVNADPPLSRLFHQGDTHMVGFAMRIEHASADLSGGGFQLMMQYHNSNPARAGYGTSNNPALSMLRANDTDLQFALRDNRPGGERLNTFEAIPGGVRAGQWVRWVVKTRFNNFDSGENGLVEVWSATGRDPLAMHFRVDDRPLGYAYENPAHTYEIIMFDMYGSPRQDDARVYVDEIRIVDGDHDPSVVDPLSWGSYQHVLNQPYDDDLSAPVP